MPTLALLTPVLIPDLHDLTMMRRADRVVLDDTMHFSRKSRVHRCRIRTPESTHWLRLPVHPDDRRKPLTQVRLDPGVHWIDEWLRVLQYNYGNSLYFDFYRPELEADFAAAAAKEHLLEASATIWGRLFAYLYLDLAWERASGLPEYESDPDRLTSNLGCRILWQEHDSRSYMRQSDHPTPMPFTHPVYHQHFEGFEPGCCLLDLLFQCGPTAWQVFSDQ